MVCTRCGRSNHKAANCFAKSTKAGKPLSKESSPVFQSNHVLIGNPNLRNQSYGPRQVYAKKADEPGSRSPPDANTTSKRTWYFNGIKYIKIGRKPNAYWLKE